MEIGCYIDEREGHYSPASLILIAEDLGWEDRGAIQMALDYFKGEYPEGIFEAADDAEEWMNRKIAPNKHSFGWWEGGFYLWPDDEWGKES